MRPNSVRTIWQAGRPVLNGWLKIASSYAAELMAHEGWDSLTIDLQHSPIDYQTTVAMLQAISTTSAIPFVRVPWNEPGEIMRMLDTGVYGIICPMINTRAEAESFVGACRYPPHGYRSFGPHRALLYSGSDYVAHANETVVTMAMIETAAAVENLDAILSTPGLDAIYVGPADLGQSLGFAPHVDTSEPQLLDVIDHIVARARAHGVIPGIYTASQAYALKMVDKGFQFVTVSSDAYLMSAGARQVVTGMRKEIHGS
ncbi:MAG: aldolase/citrate lyase family protein [Herpetosiphon sp.]